MNIHKEQISNKQFLVFIVVAFVFSIAVRMIWVYQFSGAEQFVWNGQMMINTNDGYYYAEGARDAVAGGHQENDLSPIGTSLSTLTAFLAQVLPFSFETIILYMPAFFGSLLIIPILLISRAIKEETVGFIAALLGSIVWSYYNRTMVGYFDTDMLVIVFPTLVLYGLIQSVVSQKNRYLALITVGLMLNTWWYPGSYSLNMAMIAMTVIYTAIFERKNVYFYKILLFMMIAIVFIPFWAKLALTAFIFMWFHFKKVESFSVVTALLAVAVASVLLTGGFTPIVDQLKTYVFRSVISNEGVIGLHFFNVNQTVRESGKIPFETFANRISGHSIIFVFSLIGYIIMGLKHRVMLLALPMLGLGFLAYGFSNDILLMLFGTGLLAGGLYQFRLYKSGTSDYRMVILNVLLLLVWLIVFFKEIAVPGGGLRFTVYAVPVMALGFAYFVTFALAYIQDIKVRYAMMVALVLAALYPNITHIVDYRVPTVFTKSEVMVLDALGKKAQREDYVMTWWDYGYPVRYYSDMKTLVDGGKHMGDVNFPVSFSLSSSPKASANMARLDVEYTERAFSQNRQGSYLQMMMEDYNVSDPDDFLDLVSVGDLKLPAKTRDIYYYLPMRMLDIFPTVLLFSNIDLKNGKENPPPFFFQSAQFQKEKNILDLGRGVKVDLDKGVILLGDQQVNINLFVTTQYDSSQKLHVSVNSVHKDGGAYVIYMKSYNRFLIVDQAIFNSTFIQLFALENYDPALFEAVTLSPLVKVFRSKI